MLTTQTHFDTRLYLTSGQREGEVALYKQGNYPGSEPKLLGTFSEKSSVIRLVLEDDANVKLLKAAEPVEVKTADDIAY
jgi:hypothetical protein